MISRNNLSWLRYYLDISISPFTERVTWFGSIEAGLQYSIGSSRAIEVVGKVGVGQVLGRVQCSAP